MDGKISSEETTLSNLNEHTAFAELPYPCLGYRDTDQLIAEMRAAHEQMTDEDYQTAEEEAMIICLSAPAS